MNIKSTSITVISSKIEDTRKFYEDYFQAFPVFDCGWYVVLRLGSVNSGPEICLMAPRQDMEPFKGGIFLNINVDDADITYKKLTDSGLSILIPLEDHPWGDRGFGLVDPSGVVVYCYHPIKPTKEFQKFIIERQ